MIAGTTPGDPDLLLIGSVRGLVSEATDVLEAVRSFAPQAVGLGMGEPETEALRVHFVESTTDPLVPLAPTETAEARALVRYGEVSVPNPAFVALLGWGAESNVPVEGLDADEDVDAEMFASNIGYFELVRRTVRERSLTKEPPDVPTGDAFALAWDRGLAKGSGSRKLARARDAYLATSVKRLRERARRIAVVIDRERVDGVRAALDAARAR